jgi:hypothetical protein
LVERQGNVFKTVGSAVPIACPDNLATILNQWIAFLRHWQAPPSDGAPMPAANPDGKRELCWLVPNVFRVGPWTGGSPGHKPLDRVKALAARAGVKGFTLLSLRHTFATLAEGMWGLTELQIQRQLRHTNVKTQRSYRHADPDSMRRAVGGISFAGEVAPTSAPPAAPAPVVELSPPPPTSATPPAANGTPRAYRGGPKLDDSDVAEARELRARGWTLSRLEARYHVSKSTLSAMLNGLTHRHVPPHTPPSEGTSP